MEYCSRLCKIEEYSRIVAYERPKDIDFIYFSLLLFKTSVLIFIFRSSFWILHK